MKSKTLHVMLCSLKESKKELILSLSNNFYIRHEAMWFNFQGLFIFFFLLFIFLYFMLIIGCEISFPSLKGRKKMKMKSSRNAKFRNITYRL